MLDKSNSVFVEYCIDCAVHTWCTKHDEAKYQQFFKNVKDAVETEFEQIQVYGNRSPLNGKIRSPTLGAFEVVFRGYVIFSKLKTGLWPTRDVIFERMQAVANGRVGDEEIFWLYQEKQISNQRSKRTLSTDPTVRRRLASKNQITTTDYSSYYEDDREKSTIQDLDRRDMQSYATIEARRGSQGKMINLPSVGKVVSISKKGSPPLRARIVEGRSNSLGRPLDHNYEKSYYTDKEYPSKDSITQTGESLKTSNFRLDPSNTRFPAVYPNQDRRHSDVPPAKKPSLFSEDNSSRKDSSLVERYQDELDRMYGEPLKPKKYSESDFSSYQVLKTDDSDHTSHPVLVMQPQRQWPPHSESNSSQLGYNSSNQQHKPALIKLNTVSQTGGHGATFNPTHFSQKQIKHSSSPFKPHKMPESTDTHDLTKMKPKSSPSAFETSQMNNQAQKLGAMLFPFQKVSNIKVPKEGTSKKKITLEGDKDKDCKFTIQTNMVDIVSMTTYEIMVPKGASFKIPLKFVSRGEEKTRGCLIYIFKDDKPWLKILVEITTV